MKTKSIRLNAILHTITQISALVLPLITFPYVTRVLQPENYGKVSFGNSIISYVTILAALGISTYAVREGAAIRNDRKKLDGFCSELFTFNMISTLFAFLALFILMAVWKEKADCRLLIGIMSITVLMNTVGVSWVFTIFEDFTFIAIRSVSIQILSVGLVYLLVKKPEDYIIYAAIGSFGAVLNNVLNMIFARKYVKISFAPLKNIKTYLKPILILFCSQALITVYLSADITMLDIMKGDAETGQYEVAVRIYTMIKSVLNAVITVTIPRFSYYLSEKMDEEADRLKASTVETMFVLTVPALTGLIMISNNVIMLMAGEEYMRASLALQILSVALIFAVLANFFVNCILLIHKKENMILLGTVVSAVLNIGLNFFMIPWLGLYGAAITTLVAEMSITIISVIASRKLFPFKKVLTTLLCTLVASGGIVLVCLLLSKLNLSLWLDTLLKIVCAAVVYTGLMLLMRGKHLIQMLKNLK